MTALLLVEWLKVDVCPLSDVSLQNFFDLIVIYSANAVGSAGVFTRMLLSARVEPQNSRLSSLDRLMMEVVFDSADLRTEVALMHARVLAALVFCVGLK